MVLPISLWRGAYDYEDRSCSVGKRVVSLESAYVLLPAAGATRPESKAAVLVTPQCFNKQVACFGLANWN